jgi:iron complex outermembrane receptor protein
MYKISRKTALYISGMVGICGALPAHAQESNKDNASDIVVTARRVEERLQDVPISISVLNQQQLRDRNIVVASDLGTYTPSLTVNQRYGPEKSSFVIRGFGQENGTSPSVGVYFADVVAPRVQGGTNSGNTAVTGSFMDLQNVQVLKGPQGTLFGRNTTGGAVLLVPKKPTNRFEGSIEGSVGDYDMKRIQAVLNIPVADTFRVRIAVDRNKRDGYMKNTSGIGTDSYNDVDYFAARLSVVADLTPDLENYMIATYSHSFSRGYGARIVACNRSFQPSGGFVVSSSAQIAPGILAPSACNQLDRQNARGDGPLDVDINNPHPYLDIRHGQLINTTTWRAGDTFRIKNIVSYQEYRERASFSLYGDDFSISNPPPIIPAAFRIPAPVAGTPYQYTTINTPDGQDLAAESTFSEELQFQGDTANGRLTWQAGGYLELARPLGFNTAYSASLINCSNAGNLTCTDPLGLASIQNSATKYWFNNKGIYAQGTYKLTDKLSFTAGGRYTIDETTALGQSTRLRLPNTRTCNDTVRFGTLVVTDASQCALTFHQKSSAPTWLIDLDYKPNDNWLLYGKYARGYRQGGLNLTNIGLEAWNPEKVDSFEVGSKTSFEGSAAHGFINIAAFYNNFTNQQLAASGISNVAGFNGSQPIINAGKSRIFGAEVDASATVMRNLRFDVGYVYLNTKLVSITIPALVPGSPYSALIPNSNVGDPLPFSPKNRITVTGTYTLPLPKSVGELSVGATFIHTDTQVASQATLPQYRNLPATDIVNVNVNWDNVAGRPIDLAFFVTNLTNVIYQVSVSTAYNSAGFESLLYAPPRMYGFRARFRFGS